MAYWTVTNVTKNSFKANIYNLSSNFTSDSYIRLVYTSAYYGTRSVTMGNIKFQTISGISSKTFSTTFYDLSPGTTYTLYCYAQVNDSADDNAYYLIKNSSGGNGITFVTDSEVRQMTAPNEPTLSGNRFEGSSYPNAWIYLSGMTDISARFVWQCKDTVTDEVYELELDDVDGVSAQAKEISFRSIVAAPDFCRTYKMRLGSFDNDDESNYAWSGWTDFTTQPTNRSLDDISVTRRGNKVTVSTSRLGLYSFSYAIIKMDGSVIDTLEYTSGQSNSLTVTLDGVGIYRFDITVVYRVGSTLLYAVDNNGDTFVKTVNISYQRPSKFTWTTTPSTGVAAASVPSGDWNRLCDNIDSVIRDYMGREDITIPNDSVLYGELSGANQSTVLKRAEGKYILEIYFPPGAKIENDKTLYARRYNAVNYILCCVNNSDSETDVTGENYTENFVSGKPIYARYLTALSDKVNGIL